MQKSSTKFPDVYARKTVKKLIEKAVRFDVDLNGGSESEELLAYLFGSMPFVKSTLPELAKCQPFKKHRVLVSLHLKPAEIPVILALMIGGAEKIVFVPHYYSVDLTVESGPSDKALRFLRSLGLEVVVPKSESRRHRFESIRETYERYQPDLLCLHRTEDYLCLESLLNSPVGATILTGAEIHRIERKVTTYPIVLVTRSEIKSSGENPEAARNIISSVEQYTHRNFSNRVTLVVGGRGSVGRALCKYLKLLGGKVLVGERADLPLKEELLDEGSSILKGNSWKEKGLPIADFVISVVGKYGILSYGDVLRFSKDRQIIASGGSRDLEKLVKGLKKQAQKWEIWRGLDVYKLLDGRRVYLVTEGKPANLYGNSPGSSMSAIDPVFTLNIVALEQICLGKVGPGLWIPTQEMEKKAIRHGLACLKGFIQEVPS